MLHQFLQILILTKLLKIQIILGALCVVTFIFVLSQDRHRHTVELHCKTKTVLTLTYKNQNLQNTSNAAENI